MPRIYVIHENDTWVEPLRDAFREFGLPFSEWFINRRTLDLASVPPQGVFYNRMSASSHTRGHRYAAELTGGVLAWLEAHGRRVVNDSRALALEISKMAQYAALGRDGIRVPHTIAAVGRDEIVAAAKAMGVPFITKHNRAGKGLGVRLFDSVDALERYVDSDGFEDSVDGVTLIQRYIEAREPFITRVEFVGGQFLYAVQVDTSQGFELCPADVCQVDAAFCPAGETAPTTSAPRFRIIDGFSHPLVDRYRRFLADHGIGIAGIEFIRDRDGEIYPYDVNTNTNYNAEAERVAGVSGMRAIAAYLGRELERLEHPQSRAAA
jgi:glutathione synthase/RimK-type ligase-like ATP-grasp enzyme